MIAKYDRPPYQPRWILQAQVFLLRHLRSSFNDQTMIITTTGRKTGRRHSVPIGFIPDGDTYLAINLGGHSHWYLNALTNPCVTLEIKGKKIEARAENVPTKTPQELRQVLEVFARQRPLTFKNFFGTTAVAQQDADLMKIAARVAFLRFYPLA